MIAPEEARSRMVRVAAMVLTVVTGFAGLVYEVVWQKYLATLFGSHSESTSLVLAVFLGGLAAGYAVFGAASTRAARGGPRRLLRLYGCAELGIGLYALAFPWIVEAARLATLRAPERPALAAFAADLVVAALTLGPPAVLMGATVPVLSQALARSLADATRVHAHVYAFNTAGAFAGALAAGLVLVPWLGLEPLVRCVGVVSVAAGLSFLALARAASPRPAPQVPQASAGEAARIGTADLRIFCSVGLLLGFAMMTIQVVLVRIGALAFGASEFTFALVVAAFIVCIAAGSLAVSALARVPRWLLVATPWALLGSLVLLHARLAEAPYWAHALRMRFGTGDADFYAFHLASFAALVAVLAVPVALSGATLPLLFHHLRREMGQLGRVAGRLYGFNTAGSLLGAVVGGYGLLAWLDLDDAYRAALGALALAAALVTIRLLRLSPWTFGTLSLLPLLVALVGLERWPGAALSAGLFRTREPIPGDGPDEAFALHRSRGTLRFYDDDPNTSVSVWEYGPTGEATRRSIVVNGKSDGMIPGDNPTMILSGVLPALFAERRQRAFVIGYGTGTTAGELADLADSGSVVVAEISQGVIDAAPFFEYGNRHARMSPKVEIRKGDALRLLERSDERFDVIVSEPSNPWVTGVEMLYSREFLEVARERLAPGGVYAQWMHTYEVDESSVALVFRTFASVFPDSAVWFGLGADLILLGFDDPAHALDLERLEERAARADFAASLERAGIRSFPALLSRELLPLGVLAAAALPPEIHSLYRPRLSYRAARAFFRGDEADLPPSFNPAAAALGTRNSLARRYAARFGGELPDEERKRYVAALCASARPECTTQLASWWLEQPGSIGLSSIASLTDLGPGRLEEVAPLFGRGGCDAGAPVSPDAAERTTELFRRYYHHAAPFSPQVLHDCWRRCEDDPAHPGRCSAGAERARRLFAQGSPAAAGSVAGGSE